MALLTLSFVSTGCASNEPVGNDFCMLSMPIFISEGDTLTDATAKEILAHNELGVRLCDWPRAGD